MLTDTKVSECKFCHRIGERTFRIINNLCDAVLSLKPVNQSITVLTLSVIFGFLSAILAYGKNHCILSKRVYEVIDFIEVYPGIVFADSLHLGKVIRI